MDINAIQQIFFQECEEGLAGMEIGFAALRDGDREPETINGVFRCVHSIKGGAGAFGHERLQAYTHQYETLLDLIRNGTLSLDPALLSIVIGAFDMLSDHVAAARDGTEVPADQNMLDKLAAAASDCDLVEFDSAPVTAVPVAEPHDVSSTDDFDDLMAMLDGVGDTNATPDPLPETVGVQDWRLTYRPAANALDHGAEPLLLLRELTLLGGVVAECDLSALPAIDALDPDGAYLAWTIRLPADTADVDILAVFEFTDACAVSLERYDSTAEELEAMSAKTLTTENSEDVPGGAPTAVIEATIVSEPAAVTKPVSTPSASPAGQTIRVDLDKLDRLVNLVGELVITQSMLAQRLTDCQMGGIFELSDLEHLTRDLQESTMSIRAQPMKTVFSRVPRIIRELETETGKSVRLEVEGEMTEVDKTVVERIGEPLTHLIRNAVDHGLETTEERVAAGKPAEGVVRLTAAHHSGRIVITVADDGKGIDRSRVHAKAIERGIVPADAILSDEDIDNLIFAPGFSTAATVSNISGRGVGMDVVRKNIQALGGRIGIQSRDGKGSSFSMSLPLTLAVLDGMIVTVGTQTFVIPLGHIVESLRPTDATLNRFGVNSALLDVRGAYVPVVPIADHLGIDDAERDPTKAVLIVVDGDHGLAALLVDTIRDQRQVVVKSLEANFQQIEGVAGATILGDGRVALIVDVDALTARSRLGRTPVAIAA